MRRGRDVPNRLSHRLLPARAASGRRRAGGRGDAHGGGQAPAQSSDIGAEAAKSAALSHAGVSAADA